MKILVRALLNRFQLIRIANCACPRVRPARLVSRLARRELRSPATDLRVITVATTIGVIGARPPGTPTTRPLTTRPLTPTGSQRPRRRSGAGSAEAAKLIGIARLTLSRYAAEGRLTPAVTIPGRGRVTYKWNAETLRAHWRELSRTRER